MDSMKDRKDSVTKFFNTVSRKSIREYNPAQRSEFIKFVYLLADLYISCHHAITEDETSEALPEIMHRNGAKGWETLPLDKIRGVVAKVIVKEFLENKTSSEDMKLHMLKYITSYELNCFGDSEDYE